MADMTRLEQIGTIDEILRLTGRGLDAAVEYNLFRSRYLGNGGHDSPYYSADANAVRDMEAEIERWRLKWKYVQEIFEAMHPSHAAGYFQVSKHEWAWYVLTTPLETKCRAALLAVMDK